MPDTMLFDFGGYFVKNKSGLIKGIMDNFTVILVQDQLDNSLVVLAHTLKWKLRDILHYSQNVQFHTDESKSRNTADFVRREKQHRMMSPNDYSLYEQSVMKLEAQKSRITNFRFKVMEFQRINHDVRTWCMHKFESMRPSQTDADVQSFAKVFEVNATHWKDIVRVDVGLCRQIRKPLLEYLDFFLRRSDEQDTLTPIQEGRKAAVKILKT